MEKHELRRKIKTLRSMLREHGRLQAAEGVCARLELHSASLMGDRVLMYHSLTDDLSTHKFLGKW